MKVDLTKAQASAILLALDNLLDDSREAASAFGSPGARDAAARAAEKVRAVARIR